MSSPKSSAVTAEDVDKEVEELLAKIPDKYKRSKEMGSPKRKASWKCEPLTVLVALSTLLTVFFFVYVSMSPRPFVIQKELGGSWMVDPQGSPSKRKVFSQLGDPLEIGCEAIVAAPHGSSDSGEVSLDTEATRTTGADKLVGDLFKARCAFNFGPLRLNAVVHMTTVRAHGSAWTWSGPCRDDAPLASEICTITVHRKRVLLTLHESDGSVVSYLLQRGEEKASSQQMKYWTELWHDKGKFLVDDCHDYHLERVSDGPIASETSHAPKDAREPPVTADIAVSRYWHAWRNGE